jgi:hypothetical protein
MKFVVEQKLGIALDLIPLTANVPSVTLSTLIMSPSIYSEAEVPLT